MSETKLSLNRTYNVEQAIAAQKDFLKRVAKNDQRGSMANSFVGGEGFAPSNGVCYRCIRQIYSEGGISVEKASTELITGCPFCHSSFVD